MFIETPTLIYLAVMRPFTQKRKLCHYLLCPHVIKQFGFSSVENKDTNCIKIVASFYHTNTMNRNYCTKKVEHTIQSHLKPYYSFVRGIDKH